MSRCDLSRWRRVISAAGFLLSRSPRAATDHPRPPRSRTAPACGRRCAPRRIPATWRVRHQRLPQSRRPSPPVRPDRGRAGDSPTIRQGRTPAPPVPGSRPDLSRQGDTPLPTLRNGSPHSARLACGKKRRHGQTSRTGRMKSSRIKKNHTVCGAAPRATVLRQSIASDRARRNPAVSEPRGVGGIDCGSDRG